MHKVADVEVAKNIMDANAKLAHKNLHLLEDHNIFCVDFVGAIGSGKTSLIEDIIDNVDKIIIVNCDAKDTHLETDVNNFFMAYRFHGDIDYKTNLKTGIEKVINTPVESLSVNLPLGSTIACKAYNGDEVVDKADVLVTNNSGTGIYYNQELSSVNDFKWGQQPAVIDIPEPVYYK